MERPDITYAKSGDVHIAYTTKGDADLDLVHVPGVLATLEASWQDERMARFHGALARFSRLIAFDKRGTGLSDRLPPGASPSLEDRIDDVRAVMDAVGSEEAVVMGVADGGPVAMMFAATYPERTRALVLSATAARRTWAPDHPWGLPGDALERHLDQVEATWGRGASKSLFVDVDERTIARMEQLAGTPATARAIVNLSFSTDVSDVLGAITAPTLIVHHVEHPIWPIEGARYIASHVAGSLLVELPGRPRSVIGSDSDSMVFADLIEEFVTGRRHVPEVERVLKTVLFTDIVQSTERLAEMGDHRWREVLEEFRRRVRVELERHRGEEVNTRGDDVLATFDGPARAVRCALTIQRSARALGLEVRAGVHTGEVEVDSRDITGIAVHVGARVAAAALPGEVLTTTTVRDLVAGSGLSFEDRGRHVLKGVPGEWTLLAAQD